MSRGKSGFRSILQHDRLASHTNPVILIVDKGTWAVDFTAINRAVQRRVQRPWFDTSDICIQLAQNWVHSRGMSCTFHVKSACELSFCIQLFHQSEDLRARTANSCHTRAGVDGRFNVAVQSFDFSSSKLDNSHCALFFLTERVFTFAHQAGTVSGDKHGVFCSDTAGSVGSGDFAHGHTDNTRRTNAEGCKKVRQSNLDCGNRYLGGFSVIGLGVVGNDVKDGPPGLEFDDSVEFFQAFLKRWRNLEHILNHLAVLGTEAGVDKDRAWYRRGICRGDSHGDLAVGYLTQTLDDVFFTDARHHCTGACMVSARKRARERKQVRMFLLDVVSDLACSSRATGWQKTGNRQGDWSALVDVDLRCGLGSQAAVVGEDDVRVGSTEAEA